MEANLSLSREAIDALATTSPRPPHISMPRPTGFSP
jgi:hypothetical protein